jgi:hypothetical protein
MRSTNRVWTRRQQRRLSHVAPELKSEAAELMAIALWGEPGEAAVGGGRWKRP